MRLNKKGFMLAEVVIVSATVMVTLVALYTTFNKIYTGFNKLSNYEHVDAMYAARGMYELIISENVINNYVSDIEKPDSDNKYKQIRNDESNESNENINFYYQKYKVLDSFLVKYEKNSLYDADNITDLYDFDSAGEELKDYIKYLSTSLNFDDGSAEYLIIVELSDVCDEGSCEEDNANNYFGYYKVP